MNKLELSYYVVPGHLIVGGRGSGKARRLIEMALKYTNFSQYRAVLLHRHGLAHSRELLDRYRPSSAVYRLTAQCWEFPSGAQIEINHLDAGSYAEKYFGRRFHFIGFDGLGDFTEDQCRYFSERLMRSDREIEPRIVATDDGDHGHKNWMTAVFLDHVRDIPMSQNA